MTPILRGLCQFFLMSAALLVTVLYLQELSLASELLHSLNLFVDRDNLYAMLAILATLASLVGIRLHLSALVQGLTRLVRLARQQCFLPQKRVLGRVLPQLAHQFLVLAWRRALGVSLTYLTLIKLIACI